MRNQLSRLATAAALSLTVAACAGGPSVQNGPLPPDGEATKVEVRNNNWSDMNVYVERSGMRQRLGTVTSMSVKSFRVPKAFLSTSGSVRLVADPIGSRQQHITSPVQVWPGQTVAFTIENHMAISSVSVW